MPQLGARRRPNATRAIDPSMEQLPSAEASEPRGSATSANSSRSHSMVGRSSKFSRPRPSDLPKHSDLQLSNCHAVTGALKSRNTRATVVVVLLMLLFSWPKKQQCNLCHSSMSTDGAKLVKFSSSMQRSALVCTRGCCSSAQGSSLNNRPSAPLPPLSTRGLLQSSVPTCLQGSGSKRSHHTFGISMLCPLACALRRGL